MSKGNVIGKFIPVEGRERKLDKSRKTFYVLSKEVCNDLSGGFRGVCADGKRYHVFNKYWTFIPVSEYIESDLGTGEKPVEKEIVWPKDSVAMIYSRDSEAKHFLKSLTYLGEDEYSCLVLPISIDGLTHPFRFHSLDWAIKKRTEWDMHLEKLEKMANQA